MIRTILFDLDDTLYPKSVGVMGEIRSRILDFIRSRMCLSPGEADDLRRRYLREYGTTMRGLQMNHQIDADDYLSHVHDIPLQDYVKPNLVLDTVLASVAQDKVVFTNASREHAERVLRLLGIRHHFTRIVDVRDLDFQSKPQPAAYRRVCDLLGMLPDECVLVDDNVQNLVPAKEVGMTTVLVGDGVNPPDSRVDYVIAHIEQIGTVIESLAGRDGSLHRSNLTKPGRLTG
jgi:putative hydrolase of the HAD superfamily